MMAGIYTEATRGGLDDSIFSTSWYWHRLSIVIVIGLHFDSIKQSHIWLSNISARLFGGLGCPIPNWLIGYPPDSQ